jgi:hypothetical protein
VEIQNIQSSGDGEALLHPRFLYFLRTLRATFPRAIIENYSNFSLYGKHFADTIIDEHLLDRQNVTIHSLDPDVFRRATCLNPELVFKNLDYWIDRNHSIALTIRYASIPRYYGRCLATLGHGPFCSPFHIEEVAAMPGEFEVIKERFSHGMAWDKITFDRTHFSLWAEREDPRTERDIEAPCPKLAVLENIMWVCPNGDIACCGYDDRQCDLIAGNIMDPGQDAWSIWTGPRRREILDHIGKRTITRYPCVNPRCCEMRE